MVFDGGNFVGAEFTGGTVDFGNAGFTGGTVSFVGAEFADGKVNFSNAGFAGGTVSFLGVSNWSHPPYFGPAFDVSHPPPGVRLPAGARSVAGSPADRGLTG